MIAFASKPGKVSPVAILALAISSDVPKNLTNAKRDARPLAIVSPSPAVTSRSSPPAFAAGTASCGKDARDLHAGSRSGISGRGRFFEASLSRLRFAATTFVAGTAAAAASASAALAVAERKFAAAILAAIAGSTIAFATGTPRPLEDAAPDMWATCVTATHAGKKNNRSLEVLQV